MLGILLAISEIEDADEREALRRLYYTYARRVKAMALHILKNNVEAEDATHEVFIRVIKNRQKFVQNDGDETERLLVIYCRSVCFSHYRKQQRAAAIFACLADEDETAAEMADTVDIEQSLLDKEQIEQCARAIDTLTSPAREIVLLRYYEGFSNVEIAELLSMKASTVGTILGRSLQKLKKKLKGEQYDTHR